MSLNYLEIIVLFCLEKLRAERTIYSVFHLIKGKKSSQTIQDAHIFMLEHVFKIYPDVSRATYDETVQSLVKKGCIIEDNGQCFNITNEGKSILTQSLQICPMPKYLNGYKYHSISVIFWNRLSLLVQVCSNLNKRNSRYLPIQKNKDVQRWIKRFLSLPKIDKQNLSDRLYNELLYILDKDQEIDPSSFVIRLTGFQSFGLTPEQAALELKLDFYYYHVQFINVIHYMLKVIQGEDKEIPLLCMLLEDLKIDTPLTISTRQTYSLIQQGYTIDEISIMRKLKRNTIEDHIVEMAIQLETFDIKPYVSEKRQKEILSASQKASSKQLKQIRKYAKEASYFEIRLVLNKFGVKEWT